MPLWSCIMRLKYALTIGDPRTAQVAAFQSRDTGSSHLSRDDIVASLGIIQHRCRPGLTLLYAKYTKDHYAFEQSFQCLLRFAKEQAGRYIGKNAPMGAIRCLVEFALYDFCRTVDTPGEKCLCQGRGEVRDVKASRRAGKAIMITCRRCKGTGLRPIVHTRCHQALLAFTSVSQPTYSRKWKPFYEALITWCHQQESIAEQCYNAIAGLKTAEITG
ncbi:antitermination protein [Salmonella enterica subsp. enterica serovar Teddington]|nr:antitermination protein [Salmonella enterica subsp. enterica serovar Coquilhatville]EBW5579099.1 antitermination protein [Salmonella enterica subsp. enterica serovar Teddington]ECE1929295.1 antitermination protein [Salmonella enterica]EDW6358898.1 antitermination protein [Salmonella enterica subsp. enterica]EDW9823537.1 antitermination protein [Salmonella enterica]